MGIYIGLSDEYLLGAEYARQFLRYLIGYPQPHTLGWIVRNMMQHNQLCAIDLGFMGYVSLALMEG